MIPKLRFPEFKDEWRKVKLHEIAEFKNGKAHEKDVVEYGDYIIINSKFVSTGSKVKKYSAREICPIYKDEIAIVMSDIPNGKALAKTFLVDSNDTYTLNQRVGGLKLKNDIASFVNSIINRNSYYLKFNDGVSQTNLRKEQVLGLPLILPTVKEQGKIAKFLTSVDKKIELQEQKIDNLEKYKKGIMQQIFSQKLRFTQPDGTPFPDWETKKLGDIVEISSGKSKSNSLVSDGNNIVVDMGAVSIKGELLSTKRTNINKDLLSKNDLVMVKDDIGGGNIIGKVVLIPENNRYVLGDHVYRLAVTNGVSSKFLYHIINSDELHKIFRKKANGTAQLGLSNNSVKSQTVKMPANIEQQKIADFLSAIDAKIDLSKQQLEKTKQFKKSLLQRMFV